MTIKGVVVHADNEAPIEGARVVLIANGTELAVLYSDARGEILHGLPDSFSRSILNCRVEKEGFQPQEINSPVDKEDIGIRIRLIQIPSTKEPAERNEVLDENEHVGAKEETGISLKLHLNDGSGRPAAGINLVCEACGFEVWSGVSDEQGHVEMMLTRIEMPS